MCLVYYFIRKPAVAALNGRNSLPSSSQARQEGRLTSYCQVDNYLLATYTTDNIIAEAYMDEMNFNYPARHNAVEHGRVFWANTILCHPVGDEFRLTGNCMEGLKQSMRQRVRSSWATMKSASQPEQALYALSLGKLHSSNGTPESGRQRPGQRNTQSKMAAISWMLLLPQALRAWSTWSKRECSRCRNY